MAAEVVTSPRLKINMVVNVITKYTRYALRKSYSDL